MDGAHIYTLFVPPICLAYSGRTHNSHSICWLICLKNIELFTQVLLVSDGHESM